MPRFKPPPRSIFQMHFSGDEEQVQEANEATIRWQQYGR
jgi:hypothetical protein